MEINFVFQMNSFHRYKRENPLSANAQALWVELFGLFNARRFPEEMPVSTTQLCAILGLSKDTVLRARRELSENKLIAVERGASGRAASVVKMVYFQKDCGQICGEPVDKPVDKPVDSEKTPNDTPENGAHIDANCDAKKDGKFVSQESTQVATQKKACVANIDASCDTDINSNGVTVKANAYHPVPCINPSYPGKEDDGCDGEGKLLTLEKARERAFAQLGIREYELEDNPEDEFLRGAIELMARVYARESGSVTIGGRAIGIGAVKDVFARLTAQHIRYVSDSLKNAAAPIRNPKAYLLTSLYNAPCTMPYVLKADYERAMRGPVSPAEKRDAMLRYTPEERRATWSAAVVDMDNIDDVLAAL